MIKINYKNTVEKIKYKRYILFAFYNHYPSGGMNDIIATHDDIIILKHYAYDEGWDEDHAHIFDCEERKFIRLDSV